MAQRPGLAFAWQRWERNMRTPCTISRGGVLLTPQPTMSDWKPLRCTVRADKEVQIQGADSTQTQMRWEIIFRHWHAEELPIRALDQITAQGYVYGVDTENAPQTDGITTKVYAYALYPLDSDGNPGQVLYLRFNAVVTTKRGGVVVLTAVPAQANPAKFVESAMGPQRTQTIQIAPNQDVVVGDYITVTYNSGMVRVGRITFPDQVENGGLDYMILTVDGGLLPA